MIRLFTLPLIVVLLCAACKAKDAAEKEPSPVVTAQTIVVTAQPFTETLGAIGNVVARAGRVATLSAPAPGRVASILVTVGETVRQGQVLVAMDQAPFQAALQAAEAASIAADRANDRQQRLAAEGIAPRKDAEAAAAEMAARHADVLAARRAMELSVLRTPISGVVTRMTATLGASIDPAQPVVEVADPTAFDVLLNATPTDAGRVHAGAKVTLSGGATATGEPLGIGTVAAVGATVDSVSRSVAIRVQTPATRRSLKIGETVFGSIAVGTRPNAIVIPNEALVPEGESFKVFVVDGDGVAHDREVTVGGKDEKRTEITEGLQVGERIVTAGAYGVSDSAKVQTLSPTSAPSAKDAVVPASKP